MTDMADVLAQHQFIYHSFNGVTQKRYLACSCGEMPLAGDHPTHLAAALSAAGFGPVREARAGAWDECEAAKYEIRLDPMSRFWEPYKINPYRRASDDGS